MRQLKYHEQKLLKKVDFLRYKKDDNEREIQVMRKYHVQKREDYVKYNKLVGMIASLASKLSLLPQDDPMRNDLLEQLLLKLEQMGLIPVKKSLSQLQKMTVSSFCRRRLSVVMVKMKMAETVKQAVKMIEQGHVRVGPDTIKEPAYLVTKNMEDFVTWVDSSKIKRKIMQYNDNVDDYDLM